MIRELDVCSDLLDNVESRELNDEQAKAVVCFDNLVQLIASAGSGNTSTMVRHRYLKRFGLESLALPPAHVQ
ncbi:hypothetical protein PUR31_02300 [Pseudomonas mosselii]|uniref:hypothetical protein n=1 Tax=unclassified Pseudomonas TaxID=196821 RepID=UPI0020C4F419|nr:MULTISPECIES: hypothetical protein [unclassified Pseudomonas]MCP8633419.1 hypothetical protein [Pseudomonas sp. DVZ6]MDD7782924.1 hypothetical protein [Pseudomonas sp. DVZ24]